MTGFGEVRKKERDRQTVLGQPGVKIEDDEGGESRESVPNGLGETVSGKEKRTWCWFKNWGCLFRFVSITCAVSAGGLHF